VLAIVQIAVASAVQSSTKTMGVTMSHPLDKLDVHQIGALLRYKNRFGRKWKEDLISAWEKGKYVYTNANDAALLQQVRNAIGPGGLMRVTLK
jgi:hypothetical protein